MVRYLKTTDIYPILSFSISTNLMKQNNLCICFLCHFGKKYLDDRVHALDDELLDIEDYTGRGLIAHLKNPRFKDLVNSKRCLLIS